MKRSTRSQGVAAGAYPQSERAFLRAVVELAQSAGWRCFHPWLSVHSPSGWPDLVAAKAGEPLILAELKTAVGKVTAEQQRWLELLGQVQGVEVHLWRPDNWPEIEARFLRRRPGRRLV